MARWPPHLIHEGGPWAAGTAVGSLWRALCIDCTQDQCWNGVQWKSEVPLLVLLSDNDFKG